jgi:hypothetical protein
MTRVIQTTMYLDEFYGVFALRGSRSNPGITFAWFKGEFRDDDSLQLVAGDEINRRSQEVRIFFELALTNTERQFEQRRYGPLGNDGTINQIMDADVIVENSPPEAVPFSVLLRNASTAVVGTYIGVRIAGSNPVLMLLTVPAGLLVVGSAMGVAKALEKGLNKRVLRLLINDSDSAAGTWLSGGGGRAGCRPRRCGGEVLVNARLRERMMFHRYSHY